MEQREDYLLQLASVLDDIGADQQVIIRERYIEHAFGGNGALALADAQVFARAHGCTFRYDRIEQQGVFTRSYPVGGWASSLEIRLLLRAAWYLPPVLRPVDRFQVPRVLPLSSAACMFLWSADAIIPPGTRTAPATMGIFDPGKHRGSR